MAWAEKANHACSLEKKQCKKNDVPKNLF
jgi:hypothetical protein